mmetsp:Transcript_40749/g.131956  ORF Transcript_40749/g.131956 Transcript_40749/m.131956 type:complete len:281 (-) Transcript_40749:102-944(-)
MALAGSDVLAESWTSAAPGYDELFVPRFAPWTEDALAALTQHKHSLPEDHEVLVPCCGPGQELLPIAELLGGERAVRGTDLAPGMIEIAQSRCVAAAAHFGRMSAEVGDAMAPGAGPYAAIFSVFGLQQLPDPVAAIEAWVRALAPGGVAVVCYWPMGAGVEAAGPWRHWGGLIRRAIGDAAARRGAAGWEDALAGAAAAAGAEVLADEERRHRIEWPCPAGMWEGMTRSGPWHAQRVRRGDAFVDGLRDDFLAPYAPQEPLAHNPAARLLVLRKRRSGE